MRFVLYTSLQLQIPCTYSLPTLQLQYLQPEAHLESCGTSAMELFSKNSQLVKGVCYFCRRAPSCIFDRMFDRILNATLPNNLLQSEGLRKNFRPLELHRGIRDSSCLLNLLIYTSNKENSSNT